MLNFLFFAQDLLEETAAERPEKGSQGQAQSEAGRAVPGSVRIKDQALKRATDAPSTAVQMVRVASLRAFSAA